MTMSGAKSRRDRMVIAIVVVVVLYALAVLLWFTGRRDAWKKSRKGYEDVLTQIKREKTLISQRVVWVKSDEEARNRMPHVDADELPEKTAVRWERVIERLAAEYHVNVGRRLKAQPFEKKDGEEEESPVDVQEMPVEVIYDNTSLQRLVEFLYAVNTAEDAMMDVRELEIGAKGKNVGALNGKIVLTCAYLKDDESAVRDASKENTSKEKTK